MTKLGAASAAVMAFLLGSLATALLTPADPQIPRDAGHNRLEECPPQGSHTPRSGDCCEGLAAAESEVAALRTERDLLAKLLRDADTEASGVALAWPDDVSERFTQGSFERTLRRAVDECGAGAVSWVGSSCEEPPCLGLLRVDDDEAFDFGSLITGCPSWLDAYGPEVAFATGSVECSDGRSERYALLGASVNDVLGQARDEVDVDNRRVRIKHRMDEQAAQWPCE